MHFVRPKMGFSYKISNSSREFQRASDRANAFFVPPFETMVRPRTSSQHSCEGNERKLSFNLFYRFCSSVVPVGQ